jgi:hypothetical protein
MITKVIVAVAIVAGVGLGTAGIATADPAPSPGLSLTPAAPEAEGAAIQEDMNPIVAGAFKALGSA